jgi:hypothetical protein
MIHYTTEEIIAMPGYCRDVYEREILRLEHQIIEAQKAVERIPYPKRWLEEDCEDSSRDIPCDNFQEVKIAINKTMVVLILLDNPKEGKPQ